MVLDPVAAGIGKTRTAILESFRTYPPTIVRGNASEIIALDAMWGLAQHDSTVPGTRPAGVEAVDEVDSAVDAAKRVARHLAKYSPVGAGAVAVSREAVDLVTDGERVFRFARRQRDDDEDHRRRLFARRRYRNVSGRGRTACRRDFGIIAV